MATNDVANAIKDKAVAAKDKAVEVAHSIRHETAKYMLAGFVFATGLAWNEFAKTAIETYYPGSSQGVRPKFLYAFCVTLFVAFLSYLIIQTDVIIKSTQTDKDKLATSVIPQAMPTI